MKELNFLAVEDSLTSRKMIVNCLKKIGYLSVVEATDEASALGKMYVENISFIITGWHMPNKNVLNFIKAVKEEISFKDIPILMVMTGIRRIDVIEALKAGADNFITKPFNPIVLKEKIDAILKKRVKN